MKKLTISKRTMTISAGVLVLVVLAGAITMIHANHSSGDAARTASDTSDQQKTAAADSNSKTNASGNQTNPLTQTAGATVSSSSASVDCKVLTPAAAQQILGVGAKASTTSSTLPQAADTSISACAYSNAGKTLQLAVRTPKGSLGISENATVFGSDRPSGAVTVPNLGQSAYWDPAKHQLNVLGNNNWYAITTGSGVQADAQAAATVVAAGF